jgi:hypothetical protein
MTKTGGNMKKCFPLFLVVLFLAFGCSKGREMYAYSSGDAQTTSFSGAGYSPEAPAFAQQALRSMSNLYGEIPSAEAEDIGRDETGSLLIQDTGRKIIKRANVRIRAENPDAADVSLNELMEKYGAYAVSTSINDNSRGYSIRVPSAVYNDFLAGMEGMGKLISRSENAEDVTVRYYDLEGRLATKKELLKTFQSYLGKAKNIEEILSVERRIAELQSEIEGTGMDLRRLANDVDYSTVDLYILGPVAASISYRYPTLSDRVKELFGSFGNFLSVLAVIIIGIVIFGVPVLLLLVFFFWILFGKIGLLKKLWLMAADKKSADKKDRAK